MPDYVTSYVIAVRERVHLFLAGALPGTGQYEQVRREYQLTLEQMRWITHHSS